MLANGHRRADDPCFDAPPVVRLFLPDDQGVTDNTRLWLLSELNPDEPDVAFGLIDAGAVHDRIWLGPVHLSELESLRDCFGRKVRRDPWFRARAPLSVYADAAFTAGFVVA